jgi:hypothetical protein
MKIENFSLQLLGMAAFSIITGLFLSCSSQTAVQPEPEAAPEAPPLFEVYAPEPELQLQPITRSIIEQINKTGNTIRNLQYYISDALTLENEKRSQQVNINSRGEGLLQETTTREQVLIDRETGGVLKNIYRDTNGRSVLELCFDDDDRFTLFFGESQVDQHFILIYNEETRDVNYGGARYKASFGENAPYLLIRFDREEINSPDIRRLKGRFISGKTEL